MPHRLRAINSFLLGAVLLVSAACEQSSPVELPASVPQLATVSPAPLECPTDQTKSVSGTIDILGGTLSLDGHSITLPFGAVLLPTTLTLTVPASNYMEVDITANGASSFQFEKAVSITISYQRCSRTNIDKATLSAWHFDSSTKTLLENMGGTDNKAARTVTFGSDHLSEYVIAN